MKGWDRLWLAVPALGAAAAVWLFAAGEGAWAFGVLLGALAAAALLGALRAVRAARLKRENDSLWERIRRDEAIHRTEVVRLLEANQEEMERFRSSLSHSLRMPISIIQGYAGLLEGGMVKDETAQREYLLKICAKAEAMNETLTRQLADARTGDVPLPHCIRLDLLELTRGAAEDMQTTLERAGVTMQVVSGEEHVWAIADPTLIAKVYYNLVENAVKYMGREGLITVTVSRLPEGAVQIVFQDDGMGLSEEETEHIFEINFRGSNGAEGSGRGQGLFLVRRAVLSMGGEVRARSAPGRGMGVIISLPEGTPVR